MNSVAFEPAAIRVLLLANGLFSMAELALDSFAQASARCHPAPFAASQRGAKRILALMFGKNYSSPR